MEPLLKDEMAEDYLWEVLNPVLVEALSMVKGRDFFKFLTLSLFLEGKMCSRKIKFSFLTKGLMIGQLLNNGSISQCCKLKPADPVLWLANWLITNNPNKPKLPCELAMIPT